MNLNSKLQQQALLNKKFQRLLNSTAQQTSSINASSIVGIGPLATVSPAGTANSSTYLRGDNTWASISSSGGFELEGGSATVYTGLPDIDGGSA